MCGRFVRHTKPSVYATLFEVDSVPAGPSYNIAPTQQVAAVRLQEDRRACVLLRWGMIPFWAKDMAFSGRPSRLLQVARYYVVGRALRSAL